MEAGIGDLIDAMPGLVWTALPDGSAEHLSRDWLAYTGLTAGRAAGRGWLDAIHPEDLPSLLDVWSASLADRLCGAVEARLRRADGHFRWVLFGGRPVLDSTGKVMRWCGVNIEIDESRQIEAALKNYERRYQAIFNGLPAMVTLMTPEGEFESGNQHMLDYFGETLETLKARPAGYSFHPDDRAEVMRLWRRSVQTGIPYDHEARLRRSDGTYRWFHTRGFPLRDDEGGISCWYLLQEDVDVRRRAQDLLAGEKLLLEMLVLGSPLGVLLDRLSLLVEQLFEGCFCSILLVNEDGTRFRLGSGPSLPASYNAVLDGKVIDPGYGPCSLAVATKETVISADLASDPRWKGSVWPALMLEYGFGSCWSMPILSGDQRVLGIFAIYRRETAAPTASEQELIDRSTQIAGIAIERTQADAALQAKAAELSWAHAHLTAAQRLSRTGSFTWHIRSGAHYWSEETSRILGLDPGTTASLEALRAALHADDLPVLEDAVRQTEQGRDFDIRFRINQSGTIKHLRVVGSQIAAAPEPDMYIGAMQDVTDAVNAQEDLNQARAELEHVSRSAALSAFTASIAHELNQPLAGIMTNANTCLRMLASMPANIEGARATAQRTLRDADRASQVIQRLRSLFSRKSSVREGVDLTDAAREVLALVSSDLQRRRIIVETAYSEYPALVRGDRLQLQQVILNLVMNAADAMGTVEDRPRRLRLRTFVDGLGSAELSVTDCGIGVPAGSSGRIFDAFFTTKPEGMGIGLFISRSIIEGHEGRLYAHANEGPGMTFSFCVPAISGSTPHEDGKIPGQPHVSVIDRRGR